MCKAHNCPSDACGFDPHLLSSLKRWQGLSMVSPVECLLLLQFQHCVRLLNLSKSGCCGCSSSGVTGTGVLILLPISGCTRELPYDNGVAL